uniref:chemotaxis protein CheA n=1 Tax=Thioclava electrotropha TaxID=1549850 RepID=UPI003F6F955F
MRVDIERIDRLVNLVGELVINQAMLAQSVAEAGLPPNSAVNTGLEAFMMLTRDIQDSVMMIRAQPVKPLFQRMARIVREASSAIGKDVRLKTEGETTEVDKTVIERLADPLTHMIRNAVDHGLESPDMREAIGKPREGIVTLSAHHRSGRVVIEVSDDGGGIDRKKVFEKAIEKGLVTPDAQLSDNEIDNLLFLPGFSTADQVSALSGRGVGMDVVKSSIQSLGGRISITSEPGKGSCFSISLPLTLAVLDGMVVNVAGETLVVPLSSILETATLTSEDIRALGPSTKKAADLNAVLTAVFAMSAVGVGVSATTAVKSGALAFDASRLAITNGAAARRSIPTILQLLVFAETVPTVNELLDGDAPRIRTALTLGSLAPLLLEAGWACLGLGLVTRGDPFEHLLGSDPTRLCAILLAGAAVATTALGSILALKSDVAPTASRPR